MNAMYPLLIACAAAAGPDADNGDMVQMDLRSTATSALVSSSFEDFVAAFGREYQPGSDEYTLRRSLFQRRVDAINKQNSKPDRSWTAGLNTLSDRTDVEYRSLFGWRGRGRHTARGASLIAATGKQQHNASPPPPALLQSNVDWSKLASLATTRDQGMCGSCWAVATATMLEGRYEVHNNKTRTFSVQELVNCVPNEKSCGGTGGCEGATVELAMEYVKKHGLSTEKETPYKGRTQDCGKSAVLKKGSKIVGDANSGLVSWATLPSNKARPLMEALQAGPVAVSAAASDWMFYSSGVFDASGDWIVNHAVLMVGYGKSEGKNYWKIKNSWGQDWGEQSYMRLKRLSTTEEDDGNCGTDLAPGDGVACKPYPEKVEVCGQCGLLYDSVMTNFGEESM